MTEKTKRYYVVGEIIWLKPWAEEAIIREINLAEKKVTVQLLINGRDDNSGVKVSVNLWDIDKLKKFGRVDFTKPLESSLVSPTLYVAKMRENAVLPTKNRENAGWDIRIGLPDKYETVDGHRELFIEKGDTVLVPTGLAMATDENWAISLQHERGSIGSKGFLIGAGLVDSGYRGEVFASVTATKYNLLLTTDAEQPEFGGIDGDTLIYPVSKPLVQAVMIQSPNTDLQELSLNVLQGIPSERGTGALGSTN